MDIKVEEQGDLYCVCVQVEKYNTKTKRKIIVNTSQVQRALRKMGYNTGEPVQTSSIYNLNGITQGTWFFEKKVEKPLDKPVQDVIIEVEKEVKPKPARKGRTRSSTKKVSTEE